jgi:spermidine synthase
MLDLQLQIEPGPQTPVNRDFAPIAYYFDVALWSTRFHPGPRTWFEYLSRLSFAHTLAGLAALLLALVAVAAVSDRRARRAVLSDPRPASVAAAAVSEQRSGSALGERRYNPATAGFCVAAMGFTLLGLEILLLLGFQALYGYVYHQLAILVALFMLGMAVGTKLASPATGSTGETAQGAWLRLAALQVLAAASPLVLYGLLGTLGQVRSQAGSFMASQVLFPLLAFLSGAMGGYQFPLAARVYFQRSSRSPGVLYALDLVGACVGAVVLSALLIPVFGFLRAALFMAMVNLAPAALAGLAAFRRIPEG